MNRIQRHLDEQVARATGESVAEISRRGFVILTIIPVELDPEDHIVDWDQLEETKQLNSNRRRRGAARQLTLHTRRLTV